MTRYHLAKLVDWAGHLHSRKRMQKVVYLLQSAGCQAFDAEFMLHYYGPYSWELKELTDEMVAVGLLDETSGTNLAGRVFSYRLSETGRKGLQLLESDPRTKSLMEQIQPFEQTARRLLGAELNQLELGSTIAYFKRDGADWNEALAEACRFKSIDQKGESARRALELACGTCRA